MPIMNKESCFAKDLITSFNTHKEAHGLVPVKVDKVKQGQ